jgi:hypothetical protein
MNSIKLYGITGAALAAIAMSCSDRPKDVDLGKPQFGFNAKGTLDSIDQLRNTDDMLTDLPATTKQRLHIRVTGGTRSQIETIADWPDSIVDGWIALQKEHGFGLVYVVNGNDTPANQATAIQRWISKGATFSFLEMMNEYYLPKFRTGDTSVCDPPPPAAPCEVTRKVLAADYIGTILPSYSAALLPFHLPTFVIAAPNKNNNNADWNMPIVQYLSANPTLYAGVTVHLYDDLVGQFDYAQIDALRAALPSGMAIAVTESGILFDKNTMTYAQVGAKTYLHDQQVAAHLLDGDFLFDQILYSKDPKDLTATLSTTGITPKGTEVLRLINEWN